MPRLTLHCTAGGVAIKGGAAVQYPLTCRPPSERRLTERIYAPLSVMIADKTYAYLLYEQRVQKAGHQHPRPRHAKSCIRIQVLARSPHPDKYLLQ